MGIRSCNSAQTTDFSKKDWQRAVLSQTLAGATIVALTALAAKVNLISARLSLFGAVAMTIAGFTEIFVIQKSIKWLDNKLL